MATRGVNKAIIVGNLGADPETRYMPNGTAVANMNVATTETWRDKQSGEQRERTEWHRIVVFARLAEIASEYLKKGAKVYFEGSLRTRKWQDRNGNDRYTTEIVANEMQMLDSKGSGGQQGASWSSGSQQGSDQNQWSQPAASSGVSQESSAISPGNVNLDSDFDDDVPF